MQRIPQERKVRPTPRQQALFTAGARQEILPPEVNKGLTPVELSIYRLASGLYDPANEIDEDEL